VLAALLKIAADRPLGCPVRTPLAFLAARATGASSEDQQLRVAQGFARSASDARRLCRPSWPCSPLPATQSISMACGRSAIEPGPPGPAPRAPAHRPRGPAGADREGDVPAQRGIEYRNGAGLTTPAAGCQLGRLHSTVPWSARRVKDPPAGRGVASPVERSAVRGFCPPQASRCSPTRLPACALGKWLIAHPRARRAANPGVVHSAHVLEADSRRSSARNGTPFQPPGILPAGC